MRTLDEILEAARYNAPQYDKYYWSVLAVDLQRQLERMALRPHHSPTDLDYQEFQRITEKIFSMATGKV